MPVIPVYTANIRLAYRAVCLGSLLEVTRLPLVFEEYNIYLSNEKYYRSSSTAASLSR